MAHSMLCGRVKALKHGHSGALRVLRKILTDKHFRYLLRSKATAAQSASQILVEMNTRGDLRGPIKSLSGGDQVRKKSYWKLQTGFSFSIREAVMVSRSRLKILASRVCAKRPGVETPACFKSH